MLDRCRFKKMSKNPDWGTLLTEILDLTLQKLALPDCFTFAKVCKSWRSVVHNRCRISHSPPCMTTIYTWLLEEHIPLSTPSWTLHEGQLRKLRGPTIHIGPSELIVGSCLGWLVINNATCEIDVTNEILYLLNPESGTRFSLPEDVSEVLGDEGRFNAISTYCHGGPYFFVDNVNISSSPTSGDCMVVATGDQRWRGFRIAWCILGDEEWTVSTEQLLPSGFEIVDSGFHKDELYVLGDKGDVIVFTLPPEPRETIAPTIPLESCAKVRCKRRLAESGGDLLLLEWHHATDDRVEIFKLVEGRDRRWDRVESLGDRALAVGLHNVESICTKNLLGSGFEPNCVYFQSWSEQNILVKFSMEDKRTNRIPIPHIFAGKSESIEWIKVQAWRSSLV